MKLSQTQLLALERLRSRFETAPAGYPSAGRDASRWWKTMRVLECHGFARRSADSFEITSAGREYANRVLPSGGGLLGATARALIVQNHRK
jgi:hypothetical protein